MGSSLIQPVKRGANKAALNQQQHMALSYVLADPEFDMTAACRKAGYKSPASVATKLVKNPVFAKALGKAIHERIERTKITADRVLHELGLVAFSNIQDLMNSVKDGINLADLPENVGRCISSIKYKTVKEEDGKGGFKSTRVVDEVKLWNKLDALTLLAKHLGMITEKHEVSGEIKHVLDYEQLYKKVNARVIGVDPVESAIADPKAFMAQANYTVGELVSEED